MRSGASASWDKRAECTLYQNMQKSDSSRRAVLDAALHLFSRQGFGPTSVRDIADRAGVSIGAVYHHFEEKEAIFRELIREYEEVTGTERFPFTRVLRGSSDFPDNIEELGFAARDSVRQFRPYLALIYVDVIEFQGNHIQNFYGGLAARFESFFSNEADAEKIRAKLRPNVSIASALLLTSRLFFNYFSLEILFGVKEPFGKESTEVVKEIADVLRNGICAR